MAYFHSMSCLNFKNVMCSQLNTWGIYTLPCHMTSDICKCYKCYNWHCASKTAKMFGTNVSEFTFAKNQLAEWVRVFCESVTVHQLTWVDGENKCSLLLILPWLVMGYCKHCGNYGVFRSRQHLFTRQLTFTFVIARPSVVCLSVTFMYLTQSIEIFGNVSTPFGTNVIYWHLGKILRRSSQGKWKLVHRGS